MRRIGEGDIARNIRLLNGTFRTLLGTLEDPILVKSGGPEQYVGCTGYPVDSHTVIWLTVCMPCISYSLPLATLIVLLGHP